MCFAEVLVHIMCKFLCAPTPFQPPPCLSLPPGRRWRGEKDHTCEIPEKDHSCEIIPCLKNKTTAKCFGLVLCSYFHMKEPRKKNFVLTISRVTFGFDFRGSGFSWGVSCWLLWATKTVYCDLSSLVMAPSTLSPPPDCICCLYYFPVSVCIAVYQID